MVTEPITRKQRFKRLFKRFLYVIGTLYALLILAGCFCSDYFLFFRCRPSYHDTQEIIKLTTADGLHISALYMPNPKAKYTFLYSHGNGGDLGEYRPLLQMLHDLGFAVFCYDYHGFGTSEGTPVERTVYFDADAAYDYVTKQLHVPPQRLIVYGRSLGGGPTAYLASRKPVAGVIMESTYTTGFCVVTQAPLLPFDKFRSIERIKQVHCPVLVIHGTADHNIPFSHGKALFRAAPEPKRCLWVANAGHVYLQQVAGERYPRALRDFAQLVGQYQRGVR